MKSKDNKKQEVLCYIERIESRKNNGGNNFRFYFTDIKEIDDVVGENWTLPASNVSTPPYSKYITSTYTIGTYKFDLELLEDSESFCYNDGADGVISLGWEVSIGDIMRKRLVFNFGETLESVSDKFFNREIIFESEE